MSTSKEHESAQSQTLRNDMQNGLQRIMMVEDDVDIQTVARMSLEAVGGYTVEVCSGGHEALQKVEGFAPNLILLDVMMPDMDGPTLLQHLRAGNNTKNLPIVFMTAKAQSHEVESYLKMGALAVVSKPFDPMKLSAILAGIWSEYAASEKAILQGEQL
ncbi:Response regulator receiver domain-containing protein [Abditibacterium utsteinense]|uniref:Response regulator receiver domain-containing protein n=1 Tax=Abditibacterium utsteinense TaxID=1960156 RepID=A0A2S8SW81_9BACT|nr:response regulator [Abditibacterium utsteinense]PQV65061.1 Response regulator receiver domain-containing protein [Abditibacterium utsteinense]